MEFSPDVSAYNIKLMDYSEYTAVKSKFAKSPNLCDLFKLLSVETWKRIEYAYIKPRIKVFETTITQNLIFSINALNDQFNLNIEIFEAENEKTNGNDFELIIRYPEEGLEYYAPIQAKKVYRNGKYKSMDHGAQIESLIRYASRRDAKPLYLLYNFAPSPITGSVPFSAPIEFTGCALISAEHLFSNYYNRKIRRNRPNSWLIPTFYDLNPTHAFAWHELVCGSKVSDLFNTLRNKGLAIEAQIREVTELANLNKDLKQGFYPLNTFRRDENWINIRELDVPRQAFEGVEERASTIAQIPYGQEISKQEKAYEVEKKYPDFSPKSRIILTK